MTPNKLVAKIKSASDKMRADDNTKNALRYLEQLTWLLFLKVFDGLEDDRQLTAAIDGTSFTPAIDQEHRWATWARSPLVGDSLIEFVTEDLLPYLRGLSGTTQRESIASIFQEVRTVMKSGYSLKEVVSIVDSIDFHSVDNHHAMSLIYESLLAQTADAGWSGEFYTPRPIVEATVELIAPSIGETIYDPCCGSAGFLVASAQRISQQAVTKEHLETLHERTIFGQEAGDIAALVGTMNLILHGVHSPQIIRKNTLEQDVRSIPPDAQHDVVLTNPPFGGTENPQIQQNFPAKSAATELLFLQHCMAKLKPGGRCAIVLPDGILYRTEASFATVRRRLINENKITGILRLPAGVFPTAPDIRTNLVFFERGSRTQSVRFYQLPLVNGKRYGKTNPVTRAALEGAVRWLGGGDGDSFSWTVSYEEIVNRGMDLDIAMPGGDDIADLGANASEYLEAMTARVATVRELAESMRDVQSDLDPYRMQDRVTLGDIIEEAGARAGGEPTERFIGVSNKGGLGPFKGKPSEDTSRYQRLELGDFVYNPMRVNVGSIALCTREEDSGWVSPDYVVFRLRPEAPIAAGYLLLYLKSPQGLAAIERASRGAVRRRLYYRDLCGLEVPVPADPEQWTTLIDGLVSLRRHLLELPVTASLGLRALEAAVFENPSGR